MEGLFFGIALLVYFVAAVHKIKKWDESFRNIRCGCDSMASAESRKGCGGLKTRPTVSIHSPY